MKYLIVALALLLQACATPVPVTAKFPEPPGRLATEACPQLQKLEDGAKLSDVAKSVSVNYGTYYECAIKLDAWNEWYKIQTEIFNKAK